jgi:hypothetical protein
LKRLKLQTHSSVTPDSGVSFTMKDPNVPPIPNGRSQAPTQTGSAKLPTQYTSDTNKYEAPLFQEFEKSNNNTTLFLIQMMIMKTMLIWVGNNSQIHTVILIP